MEKKTPLGSPSSHPSCWWSQVGMGPREAEELFELFDMDGSGGIDDKEFMKVPSPPSPGDSGAKANWMPDILSANFLHINYMCIYIYIYT